MQTHQSTGLENTAMLYDTVSFHGQVFQTTQPKFIIGDPAPDFKLIKSDLSDLYLSLINVPKIVLVTFTSTHTIACAKRMQQFKKEAASLKGALVITTSIDNPLSLPKTCPEQLAIIPTSAFRSPTFSDDYGVRILTGPLANLLTRSVTIIDSNRRIAYYDRVDDLGVEIDLANAYLTLARL